MLSTNVLCIKKRKKRTYCIATTAATTTTTTTTAQQNNDKTKKSAGAATTMLHITEDTPPDMLAGAMDLTVHLPSGKTAKMSVERSTPMMDLLVQITTNNHLQLSNYTLQALGMAPSSEHSDKILPFKPNTPIGALDTQHIKVIPKSRTLPVPKNVPQGHQPFESTFRLKVHLPRNQLFVTRVSQGVLLENIMKKVCEEKNLDPLKYEFRHPGNLDQVLNPKLTLSDYQITEIYVVSKGALGLNQAFSTTDIMALRKEEERKQMHNKTGGGVFNLIFRRGKSSTGSGSLSSENRSISPTHSDDSRSVTPPAVPQPIITPPASTAGERPKPPQRKRRPAPKPPQKQQQQQQQEQQQQQPPQQQQGVQKKEETPNNEPPKKSENGLTICHSRNSSDSSGYHEASILSDNCNTSLPRRPRSTIIEETHPQLNGTHSQSTSNLNKMTTHSKSTSSLAFASRKKKSAPPPPPPVLKAASSVTSLEKPSPVVASQPIIVAPNESIRSATVNTETNEEKPLPEEPKIIEQKQPEKDFTTEVREDVKPFPERVNSTSEPVSSTSEPVRSTSEPVNSTSEPVGSTSEPVNSTSEPVNSTSEPVKSTADSVPSGGINPEQSNDLESDWQYQLPSPPKAFRDSSPVIFENSTTNNEPIDSVVTNPELFEKLNVLKDSQSERETVSVISEEEKPILSKLSLENLEKRKSLVYNRELATSLKMTEDPAPNPIMKFEQIKRSSLQKDNFTNNTNKGSTLPNFKITTYDNPKQKLNIFEDDTIRSNTHSANFNNKSLENISSRKNSIEEETFKEPAIRPQSHIASKFTVLRSESFSMENNWKPSKLVTRSKSHIALNKYKDERMVQNKNEENLSKSNSLFDVSGLQSLEVIRLIQNKLNTPTNSTEDLDKTEETKCKEKKEEPTKLYQYRGVPAINMSTWSERPKVPVNVKDDPDYKHSNYTKLPVSTTNNNIEIKNSRNTLISNSLNNSVNVRVNQPERNVSIKINGYEPHSQYPSTDNNLVIKIGTQKPAFYRKPFSDINKNERPHSIAIDSDFDISRVPIVRSVEFKKPYKDFQNTTITQINQSTDQIDNRTYKSDTLPNGLKRTEQNTKPVFRVNSYVNSAPVVRGFNKRLSWNQPQSLPNMENNKNTTISQTNQPSPWTESSKITVSSLSAPPPPAPIIPKNTFTTIKTKNSNKDENPKEQLMQAIRDFGGKKGLRAAKA